MNKWVGGGLLVILGWLFFAANRPALRGYFQGDELDNIGWTPQIAAGEFAKDLVSPVYNARNFRPVGHFYFRVMNRNFGLDFPKYLWPLWLLHLGNVVLLWMVLRRLRVSPFAASAGACFFAFQMAVFDVYWKPMYAFDLFCAAFCLASLLFWMERRWVLSFAAFWLAYKSKELAVMLPAVLACYEFWFGKRRWRPLLPFLAVSLSFGLQGLLLNPNEDNDYAFRFSPSAVGAGIRYYSSAIFGVPFLGLGLLALPAIRRDRRMWLGIAAAALLLFPMILLPGRLFSAYWYVPLAGVAIAFSSLANARYGWLAIVFLAAWLPWNYAALREYRVKKLADDADARAYVDQLTASAATLLQIPVFIYDGFPPSLHPWGINGALRYLHSDTDLTFRSLRDPDAQGLIRSPAVAILTWNQGQRKLAIAARTPVTEDVTYIMMNDRTPLWQLTSGWSEMAADTRGMAPRATARLYRAARANQFEMVLKTGPQSLATGGYTDLTVLLNGVPLGQSHLTQIGVETVRWPLPPATPGEVEVEFRSEPGTLSVLSFGFLPSGR